MLPGSFLICVEFIILWLMFTSVFLFIFLVDSLNVVFTSTCYMVIYKSLSQHPGFDGLVANV